MDTLILNSIPQIAIFFGKGKSVQIIATTFFRNWSFKKEFKSYKPCTAFHYSNNFPMHFGNSKDVKNKKDLKSIQKYTRKTYSNYEYICIFK